MQNNANTAGQRPSTPHPPDSRHADGSSGLRGVGGWVFLQLGCRGQLILSWCSLTVLIVPCNLTPCPLFGMYEVSNTVSLFFQYDGAWWLLPTGLSRLPYMLGSCTCGPTLFPGILPTLIYC